MCGAMNRAGVVSFCEVPADFPKGLRVLLVDPDSSSAEATEGHLTECHYIVTKCASVTAAKQLLRQSTFDALVVEEKLILNKGNGGKPELMKVAGTTPVILIGRSVDGDSITRESYQKVLKGIQMGAVDYLHKPLCYQAVWKIWQHCVRQRLKKLRAEPATMLYDQGMLDSPVRPLDGPAAAATAPPPPVTGESDVAMAAVGPPQLDEPMAPPQPPVLGMPEPALDLENLDDALDQAAAAVAAATNPFGDGNLSLPHELPAPTPVEMPPPTYTIAQQEQMRVQNQAAMEVRMCYDEPTVAHEAGPIGLRLRKSPSFVNLVAENLSTKNAREETTCA